MGQADENLGKRRAGILINDIEEPASTGLQTPTPPLRVRFPLQSVDS